MGELITFYGKVSGLGDYSLTSPAIRGSVGYIMIPKGVKLKIWAKRIAGPATTVAIMFTRDVTASSVTWETIGTEHLASAGEITLEKRRPIVVVGYTGKEAIKFSRVGPSGATDESYVEFDIEFVWDDE